MSDPEPDRNTLAILIDSTFGEDLDLGLVEYQHGKADDAAEMEDPDPSPSASFHTASSSSRRVPASLASFSLRKKTSSLSLQPWKYAKRSKSIRHSTPGPSEPIEPVSPHIVDPVKITPEHANINLGKLPSPTASIRSYNPEHEDGDAASIHDPGPVEMPERPSICLPEQEMISYDTEEPMSYASDGASSMSSIAEDRPWEYENDEPLPAEEEADREDASQAPAVHAPPIASMFLVSGLPDSTSAWSVVENRSEFFRKAPFSKNAIPISFRPVTLNSLSTTKRASAALKHNRYATPEWIDRFVGNTLLEVLQPEDIEQIKRQVTKLSFTHDIEILYAKTRPRASLSHFDFTIETTSEIASVIDVSPLHPVTKRLFANSLTVYLEADQQTKADIGEFIRTGSLTSMNAIQQIKQATNEGRILSHQLTSQILKGGLFTQRSSISSHKEEDTNITHRPYKQKFWMPYTLTLVSENRLDTILSDTLSLSWARSHNTIAKMLLMMEKMVHIPAPRAGGVLKIPIHMSNPEPTSFFKVKMPGLLDWETCTVKNRTLLLWPLFQALDANHILAIIESALVLPTGKILMTSKYPDMLGLAMAAFDFILQSYGWTGTMRTVVHYRDFKYYMDDPGPWVMGLVVHSHMIAWDRFKEPITLVELDENLVTVRNNSEFLMSMVSRNRDRAVHRLREAVGLPVPHGVPDHFRDVYLENKFCPRSLVECTSDHMPSRIMPDSSWKWQQNRVILTLESVIQEARQEFELRNEKRALHKLLFRKKKRLNRETLEHQEAVAQARDTIRLHTALFIRNRDVMEHRIAQLNADMAALISESLEWQTILSTFEECMGKLTSEGRILKMRLDREQNDALFVNNQIVQDKTKISELEERLQQTENAQKIAAEQLQKLIKLKGVAESNHRRLMSGMDGIIATGDEEGLIKPSESETLYSKKEVYTTLKAVQDYLRELNRPFEEKETLKPGLQPKSADNVLLAPSMARTRENSGGASPDLTNSSYGSIEEEEEEYLKTPPKKNEEFARTLKMRPLRLSLPENTLPEGDLRSSADGGSGAKNKRPKSAMSAMSRYSIREEGQVEYLSDSSENHAPSVVKIFTRDSNVRKSWSERPPTPSTSV